MSTAEEPRYLIIVPEEVGIFPGTNEGQAVRILNLGLLQLIARTGEILVGEGYLIGLVVRPQVEGVTIKFEVIPEETDPTV